MITLLPGILTRYPYDKTIMGQLVTPKSHNIHKALLGVSIWAADNNCFTLGDKFDFGVFKTWLDKLIDYRPTCQFVTVPDVVGNADATAKRWQQYAPELAEWPLAYVAQDGLETLPAVEYACLFIGGSTEYKLGATVRSLVNQAKQAGKWVHMGRVNSQKRMLYAYRIGCDSFDGSTFGYAPNQSAKSLIPYLRMLNNQTSMF